MDDTEIRRAAELLEAMKCICGHSFRDHDQKFPHLCLVSVYGGKGNYKDMAYGICLCMKFRTVPQIIPAHRQRLLEILEEL